MEQALLHKWKTLTNATVPSVPTEVVDKWFGVITSRYSESHRFYHTLQHINDLLNLNDRYNLNSSASGDNEAQSASLFNEFATEVVLNAETNETVQHFINSTKSHTEVPVGNKELDYFLDFDLSVLGKPSEEYDSYSHQIRNEYIHYPDEDYIKGRARVLEKFLNIPILYRTEEFKGSFQEAAKQNLQRELKSLSESHLI